MLPTQSSSDNPLVQVRSACKTVAGRAALVHIDCDRLSAYAAALPLDEIRQPELHASRHYLGHGEDTAAFFVTLDAINFGSGYFPHVRKRPGMSGYFTVASSLNDYFQAHGPLSAEQLARFTAEDGARMFGQDLANAPVAELMGLFAQALGDLGRYLINQFDGRFARLIEAADQSAVRLVGLLRAMPLFNDVERYHGLEVPFFKRAQLTAADLHLAFQGQGLGHFTDLDQLTIFADNLVPHVLRIDEVLRYEDDLAARIDREEPIPAGSPEEVEIRACAVHAVELLVEHLRTAGQHVAPMQVDYLLWNRGQQPYYKKIRPRHRARSVYY
jgi:hypothetical protein